MAYYRLAGQDIYIPCFVPDLESFEIINVKQGMAHDTVSFVSDSLPRNGYHAPLVLSSHATGMVAGKRCEVETWSAPTGLILKVSGGSDFYIALDGSEIIRINNSNFSLLLNPQKITGFDQEILVSPALVLALALGGNWSLHASAAMYKDNVIVFLGESGQGKSTLASYLSEYADWKLVADDILPVKIDPSGVSVLPRFPQLKLSVDAQPSVHLPEQLPLKTICVLTQAEPSRMPELHKLSTAQAVQSLLGHIAGTRMFTPLLLTQHLEFSTRAAQQVPAYRMIHPHRRDTLPLVRENLEKLC